MDPQGRGAAWIKKMEARNHLKVVKVGTGGNHVLKVLEHAVRAGQPVLLEEAGETLPAALDPVLLKQTFVQQGRTMLRLASAGPQRYPSFRIASVRKWGVPCEKTSQKSRSVMS